MTCLKETIKPAFHRFQQERSKFPGASSYFKGNAQMRTGPQSQQSPQQGQAQNPQCQRNPHCKANTFNEDEALGEHSLWILPTTGLQPPGNTRVPILWQNTDMGKMDDLLYTAGQEVVIDFPRTPLLLSTALLPCEEVSGSPAVVNWMGYDLEVPDFSPWFQAVMIKRTCPSIPWKAVSKLLPPELLRKFYDIVLQEPPENTTVQIFTDGSNTQDESKQSAWAFVALCRYEQQTYLVGLDYGLVDSDPMSHIWVGAAVEDSRTAEATAIIRACEWALAQGREVTHEFLFDAQSVGLAAAGVYQTQETDRIGRVARSLAKSVETLLSPTPVLWRHVRGHSGVLGNEFADAVAKWAYQEQRENYLTRPDYTPYVCGRRYAIEFLWMTFQCTESNLPGWNQSCLTVPDIARRVGLEDRLPRQLSVAPLLQAQTRMMTLAVGTFNVNTLDPKRGDVVPSFLREQVQWHGIDILFLQETRTRQSCMVQSSTHVRIAAAANKGVGGVETWLLRRHVNKDRALFDAKTVQVLLAESQLLILKVLYQGFVLLLVNAHSPHSGAPQETIRDFWDSLRQHLDRFVGNAYLIMGIDANAHFCDELDQCIGREGLEDCANYAGECFRALLSHLRCQLPSTMVGVREGPSWTWQSSSNGSTARCDYVMIPLCPAPVFLRSYVIDSLDIGGRCPDHKPLILELQVQRSKQIAWSPKKVFDRRALQAASSDALEKVFSNFPQHAWEEDIEQHATSLSEQIHERLCKAFPKRQSDPRKGYISSTAWDIRASRTCTRQQIASCRAMLHRSTSQMVWTAWKGESPYDRKALFISVWRSFRKLLVLKQTSAKEAKQLKKQLRLDRTSFLEALASQMPQMSQADFFQALRNAGVRSSKKPGPVQPLPMVAEDDGTPILELPRLREKWRTYFAAQEDGVAVTPGELMQLCDQLGQVPRPKPQWDDLPSIMQIERQFRATKKAKAFFADGVPGDVLNRAPALMARLYYPLYLKEVFMLREPCIFKGGTLVPAYKRGNPSWCSSYRSLFVSSPASKALHAVYRKELIDDFAQQRMPMQLGGIPGFSITQAAHAVRLFHQIAAKRNRSSGVLFVDVSNAFYRLLRRHVVSSQVDDRALLTIFADMGLPEQALEDFLSLMEPEPAIEASGVSPYVKELFRTFYEATWFQIRDHDVLTHTRRGSRPGDTFADMAFGYALHRVLSPVFEQLEQDFPDMAIKTTANMHPYEDDEQEETIGILAPIWADDLAISFDADSAEDLVYKAQRVAGAVFDRLTLAGLSPNLARGKTELLLNCRGKNSLEVKRTLAKQDHMLPTSSTLVPEKLRLTGSYKHLGTWIEIKQGIRKDVSTKFAAAHEVLTRYKSQIFRNRMLPLEKKRQFFFSLVLSTMTFNMALWQAPTKRQNKQLNTGFFKLFKRFALLHFGHVAIHWSCARVLYETGLPHYETMMIVARLRYAGHLMERGQKHTWALLRQEKSWWQLLEEDLTWVHQFCPEAEVPPPAQDWQGWKDFMARPMTAWKALLRRATARSQAFFQRRYAWEKWHAEIYEQVLLTGVCLPTQVPHGHLRHYCPQCQRTFDSASACAVHSFKRHNRAARARDFVTGTTCEACLKVFPSHVDLVNHVNRQDRCYQLYEGRGLQVEREPGVNSRHAAQFRCELPDPYMQAEGPKPEWEELHGALTVTAQQRVALRQAWDVAVHGMLITQDVVEALRTATKVTFLYHDEILDLFQAWSEDWLQRNEEAPLSILVAFHIFRSKACGEWFLGQPEEAALTHDRAMSFFRAQSKEMSALILVHPDRVRYRPRMVAHLFSGARRRHDVQEYLEQSGFLAVSIDIIFDQRWGDLSRDETFSMFVEALRSGYLVAWIAGPPCETWSIARYNALPGGPRPVRRRGMPWGNFDLTYKEHKQVSMGSLLLGITLKLMWFTLLTGATSILEHPSDISRDVNRPSIWRLEIIQFYLRFAQCEMVDILQGFYGGLTPKPTTLFIINGAPDNASLLYTLRTSPLPTTSALGKAADGSWRTAVLKEYPPGLCRALCAIVEAGQRGGSREPVDDIPTEFLETIQEMTKDFNLSAERGPDFHG